MTDSRTYDLTGFDSVNISTGVRAIVTTGSPHSVRIEARDTTTLDRLDVSVVGGRLHIGFARNFIDFILNGGLMDLLRFGADFNVTAKVRCAFALEDGFNMSYLQHFAHYTGGAGGIDGAMNKADIDDLLIAPLAGGITTP